MESGRHVNLRCYPRGDRLFEEAAQNALVEEKAHDGRADDVVRNLQARLRRRYPDAVVHRRERLAEPPDDHTDVWYVYRDGSPLGNES